MALLSRLCRMSGWLMIALGVGLCLAGLGGLFLLCAVLIEEHMNGVRIVNDWAPNGRGLAGFFGSLPSNLGLLLNYYPFAAFAVLIFFPLVAVAVPLYAAFFLDDWSVIVFGWLPILSGAVLIVSGFLVREILSAPAGHAPKSVKRLQSRSGRDRG